MWFKNCLGIIRMLENVIWCLPCRVDFLKNQIPMPTGIVGSLNKLDCTVEMEIIVPTPIYIFGFTLQCSSLHIPFSDISSFVAQNIYFIVKCTPLFKIQPYKCELEYHIFLLWIFEVNRTIFARSTSHRNMVFNWGASRKKTLFLFLVFWFHDHLGHAINFRKCQLPHNMLCACQVSYSQKNGILEQI